MSPEPRKRSEPEPYVPVISGSVIGYRAWRIMNGRLYGTGANRAWEPGVNEATCDRGEGVRVSWARHSAPHPLCHCGITALARFTERDAHWASNDVRGAIEAWSDETADDTQSEDQAGFILHGTGFRARYGKVVLLAIDDDWSAAKKTIVRALAYEHGADVCRHEHLEDAAKEHGQLVSDDMLAWATENDDPWDWIGRLVSSNWGSALVSPLTLQKATITINSISVGPAPTPHIPVRAKNGRPRSREPGVSQVLGYNGPPGYGKYRRNQRIRDRSGRVWRCEKSGNPGTWALAET